MLEVRKKYSRLKQHEKRYYAYFNYKYGAITWYTSDVHILKICTNLLHALLMDIYMNLNFYE